MGEKDFKVTISEVDGEFEFDATGNSIEIVRGAIFVIASITEKTKKEDVSSMKLEESIIKEYRKAVKFIREQRENSETRME